MGLGNPILSDDGVGVRVAEKVKYRVDPEKITVLETSMGGLDVLDMMVNFDKVVLIDAIQTRGGKVGQVYRLEPRALAATKHTSTPHDINLVTALELGKRLGMTLPQQIVIYAIEVADVTTFNEKCTPEVEQAIPMATDMILRELNGG